MTTSADPSGNALREFGIAEIAEPLRAWLQHARWFGGKERQVARIELEDVARVREHDPMVVLSLWRVEYVDSPTEIYSVPLGIRSAPHPVGEYGPDHLIGTVAGESGTRIVYDALADPEAAAEFWWMLAQARTLTTREGELRARPVTEVDTADLSDVHMLSVEQSNSAVVRGQRDFLKWLRRIEPGPSIELEMSQALSSQGFAHTPTLLGHLEYRRESQAPGSLQALLQAYLHNGTEGWKLALTSLRDLYADAEEADDSSAVSRHEIVDNQGSSFLAEAARLGEVTGELHLALSRPGLSSPMTPERVDRPTLVRWADQMTSDLDRILAANHPAVASLRQKRAIVVARYDALRDLYDGGLAIRIHGDYHLGQVLRTDEGWKILDFEGEPARTVSERRQRSSPLRDVAGMLRSFDYAAAAALSERMAPDDPDWPSLFAQGDAWAGSNREAFWAAYLSRVAESPLLPAREGDALVIRRAFELSKAVYEVGYELGHRPEWVDIPLHFLLAGVP